MPSARAPCFTPLEARGSSEREFACLWTGFWAQASTAEAGEFRFVPELARRLLAWAPAEALMRLPGDWWREVGAASLGGAQWRVLFEAHARELPLALFEQAPPEREAEALLAATRALRADVVAGFWRRAPEALLEAVRRAPNRLDVGRAAALPPAPSSLVGHGAARPHSTIVELLPSAPHSCACCRAPARAAWLLQRAHRCAAPGLRAIYALFDELERRCAPVRNASPARSLPPGIH